MGDPRVLFVGHSAKRSGGELALVDLIRGLEVLRSSVLLLEHGPMAAAYAEAGAEVRVVDDLLATNLRRTASPVALLPAAVGARGSLAAVRREILARRPDVVVSNSMKASLVTQLAVGRRSLPLIHLVREQVAAPNFGRHQASVIRSLLRHAHLQIANSPLTEASLRGRTAVVPPAITVVPPTPMSTVDAPDRTRLLVLGGISPAKGQLVALGALRPLLESARVSLDIVGCPIFDGDRAELERLHAYVALHRLDHSVRFRGWTDDPSRVISEADVVVVPTRIREGFSQVAAQALILGKPAVVPDDAGIVSLFADHPRLRTFERDRPGAFEAAIDGACALPRLPGHYDEQLARRLSVATTTGSFESLVLRTMGCAPQAPRRAVAVRRTKAPA